MRTRKIFIFFLLLNFLFSQSALVFASNPASEFLCEVGIELYKQGHVADALHEFRKSLLINPGYEPAQKYIDLILRQHSPEIILPGVTEISHEKPPKIIKGREEIVEEYLNEIEKGIIPKPTKGIKPSVAKKEKQIAPALPSLLILDENIKTLKFPLEIEQGKSIVIRGENISRFLATQPDILNVERNNPNEILITGKNLGSTFLHVWDDRQRWTLEFLTIPPKPEGQTLEEELRQEEEISKNFKLRYSLDWSSFETGRRLYSLKRQYYSWTHNLTLRGETPYGILDSGLAVSAVKTSTDLTYLTIGLEKGKIGSFKDFSLRALDFTPVISNLSFSSGNLRGVTFESPAFNQKIDYTLFWGREGGGRYAGLSPGLQKIRNSFLSGLGLRLSPQEKQDYKFSIFHGWGRDRLKDLQPYGYDLSAEYHFDKRDLNPEIAYDSKKFAYLLRTGYGVDKFSLASEFRDTAKDFKSSSGLGYRAGELGLLNDLNYRPFDSLDLSTRLDIYQDRLFPRPGNPDIWNEDFNWSIGFRPDSVTNLRLNYQFQNFLGKLSPYRSHSAGIGLYRTFDWIRKINTYINYRYNINRNFTNPGLDYKSNKVMSGIRFNLIKDVDYFFDQEFSWVEALSVDESAAPRAFQTGLEWSSQLLKTPFYGTLRFIYRDEENTISPFSFLSGEDYIEGYAELNYRPTQDIEAYVNTRVRNVWADNPKVNKHIDVNLYSGVRYLWDTGVRWEATGTVEGYVFKDLNSDGLRQKNEPPIQGIKIWLGKDKSQVTDRFGYYKFAKVKAKKVYINIDTTTIPSGFTLTVPAMQEAVIEQAHKVQINFGLITRREITGVVFEDVEASGQLGTRSVGIKGVVLTLEDGTKVTTDDYGKYTFKNVSIGRHKFTLDLNSLPAIYIPTVPIFKEVEVSEGTSFTYNIPLRKTR